MTVSHAPLPPLPEVGSVVPFGPDDQPCFDEIRAVLERHGALHRFGITLLHKHFDLAEDEVLLESSDVENRILVNTPTKSSSSRDALETSWRLDDPTGQRRCETQCQPDRDSEGKPSHNRVHYTTS